MTKFEKDFSTAIEEALQHNIEQIGVPCPGHLDENGNLTNETIPYEIRNKFGTASYAREKGRDDIAKRVEQELRSLYPNHHELIDELSKKSTEH